jgi:LEA14-like dessication related protein
MAEKVKEIYVLLLLVGMLVSLAPAKSLRDNLAVSLQEKRIQDLDFTGLSLIFYLRITSSSSKLVYLAGYDYRLVINGGEYIQLNAALEESIEVEPQGSTLISLPLKITNDLLFKTIQGIEGEDKAACYLSGGFIFLEERKKQERIPFAFTAEFPILKKPEIEFIVLKVNDLTIGGADLTLEVKFRNTNGFELLVDRLKYRLSLGDRPIGEERIVWGDKNIEKKGEKVFSLPVLLNFFEVGKEVYDILHQPAVICQMFGEAEVSTSWGRIKLPFEKRGKIVLSKAS